MTAVAAPILAPPSYVVRPGEHPDRAPARVAWRAEVKLLTEQHREGRARAHKVKAIKYELTGEPSKAQWHRSRATGQRERFERVAGCRETYTMTASCTGCGVVVREDQPMSCSHARLCIHCRGQLARRMRARLIHAAMYWVAAAREANIRERRWGHDRLGVKMLTLTVPHSRNMARDARVLRESWGRFRRALQRHLDLDRMPWRLQYWRAREETPGTHADGHVHWHVLLVAPYVHHAILRLYWARALPPAYRARLRVARIEWSADGSEVVAIQRTLASGEERTETIESRVVRQQLARALVTRRGPHGRALTEMPWPVIDIRGAAEHHRSARGQQLRAGCSEHREALVKVVAEAAKYVTKDVEYVDSAGGRHLVDPAIYAALYCATDGQRRTSCTMTRRDAAGNVVCRGWWYIEHVQPYVRTCSCCGHQGPLECSVERIGAPMTRGP